MQFDKISPHVFYLDKLYLRYGQHAGIQHPEAEKYLFRYNFFLDNGGNKIRLSDSLWQQDGSSNKKLWIRV